MKFILTYYINLFEIHDFLILSIIPIMFYSKADSEKINILTENRGKAGIYQWTHISSGRCYIGSSYNLSKRLSDYFSFKKKLFF